MPPRSNDRSVTTCRSCRRRKIRCDRSRPTCARCRETSSLCVYEERTNKPIQEYRFVEESTSAGGTPSASTTDSEQAESLRRIETLLDRLRMTTDMLKAQLGANTRGDTVETGSLESLHSARQQSGVQSDLWSSMQQDVLQLHAILGQSSPSVSIGRSESISPLDEVQRQQTDHAWDGEGFDWGGLEQFFPELQSPGGLTDERRIGRNAPS